jgi:succinate dehydrogenase hydrophobic anchor subunit
MDLKGQSTIHLGKEKYILKRISNVCLIIILIAFLMLVVQAADIRIKEGLYFIKIKFL